MSNPIYCTLQNISNLTYFFLLYKNIYRHNRNLPHVKDITILPILHCLKSQSLTLFEKRFLFQAVIIAWEIFSYHYEGEINLFYHFIYLPYRKIISVLNYRRLDEMNSNFSNLCTVSMLIVIINPLH